MVFKGKEVCYNPGKLASNPQYDRDSEENQQRVRLDKETIRWLRPCSVQISNPFPQVWLRVSRVNYVFLCSGKRTPSPRWPARNAHAEIYTRISGSWYPANSVSKQKTHPPRQLNQAFQPSQPKTNLETLASYGLMCLAFRSRHGKQEIRAHGPKPRLEALPGDAF